MKKENDLYILTEEEMLNLANDFNMQEWKAQIQISNERAEKEIAIDAIGKIQLPSYFSVIPAEIRYDRQLSWFDKVLFSEIVALTTVKQYCYATNNWFSKVFGVSDVTITRSIKNLSSNGYIYIDIDKKEGNVRKIWSLLLSKKTPTPIRKNEYTPIRKNDETRAQVKNSLKAVKQVYSNKSNSQRQTNKPDVKIDWLEEYIKNQD